MATLIPAFGSVKPNMTSGERRFAERLESHLEEDYLCWYDVPVGEAGLHPDFVVLNPRRGLLILEVKDWRLDTIQRINRRFATIMTLNGPKEVTSPMEQARRNAHAVASQLEGDPQLAFPPGHRFAGRLMVPWGYGVVLANITRRQFEQQTDLDQVFSPQRVICRDEMTESVEVEAFQIRLWSMFRHVPESPLTLPQIDRIRWHLFPEIRIRQGSLFEIPAEGGAAEVSEALPDIMRVMDLQQEQLARSLGSGHRIIHGAAGAGKTLVLVYRCIALAGALTQPILVLCYNKTLAARLETMLAERGLAGQVHVRNFHRWCSEQCRTYNVALPPQGPDFFSELVQVVIEATDRGQIPSAQYGAVMIDEAHDFQPEWMKLAVQMVDPKTDSLLVLYDDAQSIYGKHRKRFTFSSVGIQARGRTTVLRVNYRNTEQILRLATDFARELLDPREAEEDGIPLIKPESAGREGPEPLLVHLPNLAREAEFIGKRLLTHHHDHSRPWSEMAVICRAKFIAEAVERELTRLKIPSVTYSSRARHPSRPDRVSILTMHSSKGLEFPVVAVAGLGYLPLARQDAAEEARLLYVAMTRSLDHLILTGHRNSAFVQKLHQALSSARKDQAAEDMAQDIDAVADSF